MRPDYLSTLEMLQEYSDTTPIIKCQSGAPHLTIIMATNKVELKKKTPMTSPQNQWKSQPSPWRSRKATRSKITSRTKATMFATAGYTNAKHLTGGQKKTPKQKETHLNQPPVFLGVSFGIWYIVGHTYHIVVRLPQTAMVITVAYDSYV